MRKKAKENENPLGDNFSKILIVLCVWMFFFSFAAHVRLFADIISQPSCQHIASISNIGHCQFNRIDGCRTGDGSHNFAVGKCNQRQSTPRIVEQFDWCHVNTSPARSESGMPPQNTGAHSGESGEEFYIFNFGTWIDVCGAGAVFRFTGT